MQKVRCPQCGAENYESDPVCLSCGADMPVLHQPPPPTVPSAQPPAARQRRAGLTVLWVACGIIGVLLLLGATGHNGLVMLLMIGFVFGGIAWLAYRLDRTYPGRSVGVKFLLTIVILLWFASLAWVDYAVQHGSDEFEPILPVFVFLVLTLILFILGVVEFISGMWG